MSYWQECVETTFHEAGIVATREQIEQVVGDVESWHENYGTAHYTPPPRPVVEKDDHDRIVRGMNKDHDDTIARKDRTIEDLRSEVNRLQWALLDAREELRAKS